MGKSRVKKPRRKGEKKRWSIDYVKVGRGPNKEQIAQYHARTQSMRTGEPLPVTLGMSPMREAVLQKMWAAQRSEDTLDGWHRFMLDDRGVVKFWVYFRGRSYHVVKEDSIEKTAHWSIIYSDPKRIRQVYSRNRVLWSSRVEVLQVTRC